MKTALFYEVSDGKIRCQLCPHRCLIDQDKAGICRARKNIDGKLYSIAYGRATSLAFDPIEKKPLYHFYPGSVILSFGSLGCNFDCQFCQNWQIVHLDIPTRQISPEQIVEMAESRMNSSPANIGIAYTYNEPIINYEYILDTGKLAHEKGLKNVLVTNGFINPEPLEKLFDVVDAMNVDVKSFRDDFYRRWCKGRLDPVLKTCEMAVEAGCHVEVTNLIIPTLNDSSEEIEMLVDWVAESLGDRTPLHFSRYYPHYKMDIPPTSAETLQRARDIALKKLKYVYIGNIRIAGADDTYCPNCGAAVIERQGFSILRYELTDGKCNYCGSKIDIVS